MKKICLSLLFIFSYLYVFSEGYYFIGTTENGDFFASEKCFSAASSTFINVSMILSNPENFAINVGDGKGDYHNPYYDVSYIVTLYEFNNDLNKTRTVSEKWYNSEDIVIQEFNFGEREWKEVYDDPLYISIARHIKSIK